MESRPPIGSGLLNPPSPQGRRGPSLGCPPTQRGPLQQLSYSPHQQEQPRLEEEQQELRQEDQQQQRRGWWWWLYQWLCLAGCADASSGGGQQQQERKEERKQRRFNQKLSSALGLINQENSPLDTLRGESYFCKSASAAPTPDSGGAGGAGGVREDEGGGGAMASSPSPTSHCFAKRTFHKPVYCHHCTDLLWGIIGQGFTCEGVCVFV